MSSHARSSRAEGRRLSLRTLIIASAGSATAAILTSQFWIAGTPIAAALTPVIVALVSELLHRPTERIAQRLTTETRALPETDALPEAAGAGPPPRAQQSTPEPAREAPSPRRPEPRPRAGRPAAGGPEPEFRVYRSGASGAGRGAVASRLPWKPIFATAAIAFVIAAAMLTLPELIAGQSLGSGDRNTTLWGGGSQDDDEQAPEEQGTETEEDQPTEPRPEQPGQRDRTTTAPEPAPEETAPTTPTPTTPTPAQPRSSPPRTAPAPP